VAGLGTYSFSGAVTGAAVAVPFWFSGAAGSWFLIAGLAPGVGAVVGGTLGVCLGVGKARGARAGGIGSVVLIAIVVAVLYGVALLILSSIGPE